MCSDDSNDCVIIKIIGDNIITRVKKESSSSDNEIEDEVTERVAETTTSNVPNGGAQNIFIQDEFFAIINSENDEKYKKKQSKRQKKEIEPVIVTETENVQKNPEPEDAITQTVTEVFEYDNEEAVPTLSLPESSEDFLLDAFPCYSIVQCSDDLNAVLDTGQDSNLNQICTELEPFLAFSQKNSRCDSVTFSTDDLENGTMPTTDSVPVTTASIIINVDRSLIPQQSNLSMPIIDDMNADKETPVPTSALAYENGNGKEKLSVHDKIVSPSPLPSPSSMLQSPLSSLSSESPPSSYPSPLRQMFSSSSPPPIFNPPVRKRLTTDPRNYNEIMSRTRDILDLKLVKFDYCANDVQVRRTKSRSFNRVTKTCSLDQLLLTYNIKDILARYKVQKKKGRVRIGPTKPKFCHFFKKPNRRTSTQSVDRQQPVL